MEQPLVSIIVNCYNSAKYLRPTIESILGQTFSNYEVIFWDNQSTDETSKIIKSYKDTRFVYYYAPTHVTLGEARNYAMEKVSGRYVTFLDSDDVWLPKFLYKAIKCMEQKQISFYFSNYYNWIEGKLEIINNSDKNSSARSFGDLLTCYRVGMSAAVFSIDIARKSSLKFNNKYQLIEDYDFFLNLVRKRDAYYDAEPLMKYRMHDNSLTNSSKKNWANEFDMLYHDLATTILSADEKNKYREQLNWLKVRAINARAEEFIQDGKRFDLLNIVLRNIHLNKKLLFPLVYIITSRTQYYKLKAKLQKSSYHI